MTDHISYLGIGSNIETQSSSRFDFLSFAVRQLSQHEQITVTKASHVYETQPVGFSDQENFYNAALEVSTTLEPTAFLRICLDVVEKRAGRTRTIKDGPRTLDVDVLTFDDITLEEESLTIPHPRMRERAFVMVPLAEIAPDFVGDLSQYDFVDDVAGVVKLDLTFEDVLKSYKETE